MEGVEWRVTLEALQIDARERLSKEKAGVEEGIDRYIESVLCLLCVRCPSRRILKRLFNDRSCLSGRARIL